MTMGTNRLFDPKLHTPLLHIAWDEDKATSAIANIVDATLTEYQQSNQWSIHPDLQETYQLSKPSGGIYFGSAGVLLALKYLGKANNFSDSFLQQQIETQQQSLIEYSRVFACDNHSPAFLTGSSGIHWTNFVVSNDPTYLDALYNDIKNNINSLVLEYMWGSPGTMLASLFAFNATQDDKWIDLFQQSANFLFKHIEYDNNKKLHYWTQHIYNLKIKFVGLIHGFAGNYFALHKGLKYLTDSQQQQTIEYGLTAFEHSTIHDDQFANWPAVLEHAWDGCEQPFVQICHGSPAMILAYADFWSSMSDHQKQLMLKGAELTWHAGPLKKPWGLCHGTAGNGWTFLKMAKLTGDDTWLDRAKAFAMTAIAQSEQMFAKFGHYRSDFWCGDLGLAVYLQACLNNDDQLISLDF